MSSRIAQLLAGILSSVYGRDIRQTIHDAIEQCYTDVTGGVTIAETAASSAISAASQAESRTTTAISSIQTSANTAIANCNSATSSATIAAANANTKANAANQAVVDVLQAFNDLGLVYADGKLCVHVERK